MASVFVGVGSNLDHREGYVQFAHSQMRRLPDTHLIGTSRVYETDAVGPIPQGRYLNAAVELETRLDPFELLGALRKIEGLAGRPAQRVKWGPRTLDLDLLLFGGRIIRSDELVVPHPMMHERWFVLRPLSDLAPRAVHPLLGATIEELLARMEQGMEGAKQGACVEGG